MKRLVVCVDGTWNTPDQSQDGKSCPTNVTKMARAVALEDANGTSQVVFYGHGVGTGNFLDRWTGGAFGLGLERNVEDAYRFLVHNFVPGDEIFVFGFSRGAFTARSTVGFIRKCGILRRDHADLIPEAYRLYKSRIDHPDQEKAVRFRAEFSRETRVRFLGVWDTVGALGIPVSFLRRFTKHRHEFHDVALSRIVDYAYHALAIDEQRKHYVPALWTTKPDPNQVVEQVWFPGAHSNVGGGYPDAGLADAAFQWMKEKAEAVGLAFDHGYLQRAVRPEPLGVLRDSRTWLFRLFAPRLRAIDTELGGQSIHPCARSRFGAPLDPRYRPANALRFLEMLADPAAGRTDGQNGGGPGATAGQTAGRAAERTLG